MPGLAAAVSDCVDTRNYFAGRFQVFTGEVKMRSPAGIITAAGVHTPGLFSSACCRGKAWPAQNVFCEFVSPRGTK
ncbi:hypothetical protein PoB_002523100 [Plakobranchus ocellatus]|uniref:Uncharacterized protein n=1 Tax=Plakobranchus ocellatus TaxID=259542 RepID=A0AAV3ZW21_9GAST|nr:hypothetical protein PoB_002523100 [Plakobranchus ocellatus]